MAQNETVDILLIGSGAAGGPFAWHLSQVPGIRLMCLEQGDWAGTTENRAYDDEQWLRLVQSGRESDVNYFRNGYPYDHSESYWEPVLGHNVGGATVHYGAGFARLRASDFLLRSLTGVGDDWPIRYEDLAPYYDLNDNHVGVTGVPGNPAYPNRQVTLLPMPGADVKQTSVFQEAAYRLGWHSFPSDRAIISVPFKGRDPRNYKEAKNRADVVHWPEAVENGVVLKTRATVREVTVNNQGLADGAVYYDADGQVHEQKARLVVLACNSIGTARVLLNSKSNQFPDGLANGSGLVGRGLMGHPLARVVGEFEAGDPDSVLFQTGASVSIDEFYDMRRRGDAIGGFTFGAGGFSGPVAVALGTPRESISTIIPASLEQGPRPTGHTVPWGRRHHVAFEERFRRTSGTLILCSELAEETNRVELDPTLTDEFGTPAPKLIYTRSENTVKLLRYAMERGKQFMEEAGATKVTAAYDVNPDSRFGYDRSATVQWRGAAPGHYLGTARMGTDPGRSVVNKWGRAHDVRNLFIIDGSVFTTAGSSGPTSTIQAIGLRTADYIKTHAQELLKKS